MWIPEYHRALVTAMAPGRFFLPSGYLEIANERQRSQVKSNAIWSLRPTGRMSQRILRNARSIPKPSRPSTRYSEWHVLGRSLLMGLFFWDRRQFLAYRTSVAPSSKELALLFNWQVTKAEPDRTPQLRPLLP